MSYSVKQGNILGRIGTGIGKGLADQVPKEMERGRLAAGLQALSQEKNLTPFEQYSRLLTLPGMTPQGLQGASELLKQQGTTSSLMNRAGQPQAGQSLIDRANAAQGQAATGGKPSPSITTTAPIEATTKPYIPKTPEQIKQRAGELLRDDPGLYQGDPYKAIEDARAEDATELSRSQALQGQRQGEQNVQNTIKAGLQAQNDRLGANVPGNVYSQVEDKAINAVKPKNEGGEGLTEQQAQKKYGDELDAISRDYQNVETVGSWKLLTAKPETNKNSLKALRNDFKKRGDLENFAAELVDKNGLTPSKAAVLAFPVSENKALSNHIKSLRDLNPKFEPSKQRYKEIPAEIKAGLNERAYVNLGVNLTKEDSILSIAEELKSRGYDPEGWMKYVDKNRKFLDLSERQGRELSKGGNFTPSMDDLWMFYMSGLDPLIEEK